MRLSEITVRNTRIHRECHLAFAPGVTLVGGPNESGKSTLVEALHRALFLKAKGNTEYHRALLSRGQSELPRVELRFTAGPDACLLQKRFGPSGGTTLESRTLGSLQGDAAESALASLLKVESANAKAAVQAQWSHLWIWQGTSGQDPTSDANARGHALIGRLQSDHPEAGALRSALDARVAQHFSRLAEDLLVRGDQPRAGTDWARAEADLQQAGERLARATERLRDLESNAALFAAAGPRLERLDSILADLNRSLAGVDDRARQLASLRVQESAFAHDALAAADALAQLRKIDADLRAKGQAAARIEAAQQPLLAASTEAARTRDLARTTATNAETRLRAATENARNARLAVETAGARREFADAEAALRQLGARRDRVQALRGELARLAETLGRLPRITSAALQKLATLEAAVTRAEASLAAAATRLTVEAADLPVRLDDSPLAPGQSVTLSEGARLYLGDHVRIHIQPGGATSLANARQAEADARAAFRKALDDLGVDSIPGAAALQQQRTEAESRRDALEAELKALDPVALENDFTRAQESRAAALARLEHHSQPAPDPGAEPASLLTAVAEARARSDAAEQAEAVERTARDAAVADLEAAERRLAECNAQAAVRQQELDTLRAQLDLLQRTHGDEPTRLARQLEAEAAAHAAQARLATCRAAIAPLQPDTLDADRERFRRALATQTDERDRLRTERAVAGNALRLDGGLDPAADLAEAQAAVADATARRDAHQRRALAVRLVKGLFDDEQRALAERFTRPLADRISGYLRFLFGPEARARIEFDGTAFTGLSLERGGRASFAFDELSGGTREQLAAAMRLAMAELLAADHDGCLPIVFDDAFTSTDPERLRQILGMLDLAARRGLQVIVLTCDPDAYAALGVPIVHLR